MKLTEEEQTEAGRSMVKAALEALGKFREEDHNVIALRVVRAIDAAAKAKSSETKRLTAEKGDYVILETGEGEAVATAFYMWLEQFGPKDVSDFHPCSVAGSRLIGLVQGFTAALLMEEAMEMMIDGWMIAGHSPRAAQYLSAIYKEEDSQHEEHD